MSIKKPSIDAYKRMKESGLLTGIRDDVYQVIMHHGPLTQRETFEALQHRGLREYSVRPRFSELVDMDCIEEFGEKKCTFAGTNAIAYRTTGRIGVPLKREKNRRVNLDLFWSRFHNYFADEVPFVQWNEVKDFVDQYNEKDFDDSLSAPNRREPQSR